MAFDLQLPWGVLLAAIAVAFLASFAVGTLVVLALGAWARRSAAQIRDLGPDTARPPTDDPAPAEALPRVVDPVI
jgi:hypothetical protein